MLTPGLLPIVAEDPGMKMGIAEFYHSHVCVCGTIVMCVCVVHTQVSFALPRMLYKFIMFGLAVSERGKGSLLLFFFAASQ